MQKKYNYQCHIQKLVGLITRYALINTRLLQYIFEIRYNGIYFITKGSRLQTPITDRTAIEKFINFTDII